MLVALAVPVGSPPGQPLWHGLVAACDVTQDGRALAEGLEVVASSRLLLSREAALRWAELRLESVLAERARLADLDQEVVLK